MNEDWKSFYSAPHELAQRKLDEHVRTHAQNKDTGLCFNDTCTLAQAVLDRDARIQEIEGGGLYRPVAEMNAHIMKLEARIAELETEQTAAKILKAEYEALVAGLRTRIAELERIADEASDIILERHTERDRYKAALEAIAKCWPATNTKAMMELARTVLEDK